MSSASERVKKWRNSVKDRMVEAMGGKCQCCGYDRTNRALAFHHIDPEQKDIGFGDTRANPKSWSKIAAELKKCILVCHNCHSEIHDGLRILPEKFSKFDENFSDYKLIGKFDKCPACDNLKHIKNKFCSKKCAQTNRRKVDWDSINLLDLMEKHSISELEKMLNISNAAIYKRRDKILSQQIVANNNKEFT